MTLSLSASNSYAQIGTLPFSALASLTTRALVGSAETSQANQYSWPGQPWRSTCPETRLSFIVAISADFVLENDHDGSNRSDAFLPFGNVKRKSDTCLVHVASTFVPHSSVAL